MAAHLARSAATPQRVLRFAAGLALRWGFTPAPCLSMCPGSNAWGFALSAPLPSSMLAVPFPRAGAAPARLHSTIPLRLVLSPSPSEHDIRGPSRSPLSSCGIRPAPQTPRIRWTSSSLPPPRASLLKKFLWRGGESDRSIWLPTCC
jgi:hypothetical protein